MAFDADKDNETLPPGVVSQQAGERMLEITGTEPTGRVDSKRDKLVKHAFTETGKPKTKWTVTEVRRMATREQWDYGLRHGHLDVGTVAAVGNLLLKGMSPTAARRALGITLNTWNTWYERGTGEDVGTRPSAIVYADNVDDAEYEHEVDTYAVPTPQPQAPYNVFAFVVDHSQAVVELRVVTGWLGHADRDWRAAQAYLVARNPDDYNPTSKTTIDTTIKGDVHVSKHTDANDLMAIASILAKAGALPSPTASAEVIEVESVEVDQDHATDDQ